MTELPPLEIDPESIRSTADQVLARPAYIEASRPPSLQERALEWIIDMFRDILGALSSVGGRSLAIVIIAVMGAGALYLAIRLVRSGVGGRRGLTDVASHIEIEAGLSSKEWTQHAIAAEDDGRWRDGLRFRHRALVTELTDRGAISAVPGQTAGAIATSIGHTFPEATGAMDQATAMFKDVWYGTAPAGPDLRDRFIRLADTVIDVVTHPTDVIESADQRVPAQLR